MLIVTGLVGSAAPAPTPLGTAPMPASAAAIPATPAFNAARRVLLVQ